MSAEYSDHVISAFESGLTDKQRAHIGIHHDGEGYVVERFFPAPHHLAAGMTPLDRTTAARHIGAAQEHFAALRDLDGNNLVVPEVIFELRDQNDGSTAIRSLVEFIPGQTLEQWRWSTWGQRAPHQPQAARLASSLTKFFANIAYSKIGSIPTDISSANQYAVTEGGSLVLHDTDPLILDIDPDTPEGRWHIIESIRSVQAWTQRIQTPGMAEELNDQIEDTIESISL